MNNIVKVSIGKSAFALEYEAYARMNAYINSLKECFAGNPEGSAILEEVEERSAALLRERCGEDGVVTLEMVREVIDILGAPKKHMDGISPENEAPKAATGDSKVRKRFMRDVANKKIAGVCSGVAAYFNREAALVRILFIVATLLCLFMKFDEPWFLIPAFVYLALWCAMPAARTSEQKARMRGRNYDIDDILEEGPEGSGATTDNTLSNAIRIAVGIMLIFFGISGLLFCSVAFTTGLSLLPTVAFPIFDSIVGKCHGALALVCAICLVGLPTIGMLYGGIMLSFGLRAPKWHPGLVIFLLWLLSLMVGGYTAVRTTLSCRNVKEECISMNEYVLPSDTLRIEIVGSPIKADDYFYKANKSDYELLLLNRNEVYMAPEINVYRHDANTSGIKSISINAYSLAIRPNFGEPQVFTEYSDGTLRVKALTLGKGMEMKDILRRISVTVPADVKIILDGPRKHDFEKSTRSSSLWFCD